MLRIIRRFVSRPSYRFCTNKPQRPDKQTIQKMQKQIMDNMENNSDVNEKPDPVRLKWILGMTVAGVFVGYWITTFFEKVDKKQNELINRTDEANFGGNWKMNKLDGTVLTDKDMLGTNYVIYFGFTRCPDVCPAFMFKLTTALKYVAKQESSKMFKLVPIYVSLDPQYDTPQRIAKFLENYHPQTIGLCSLPSQPSDLQNIKKQFNVFANKIQSGDTYTIDHTNVGYLMSEDGKFLTTLGSYMSSKEMASNIQEQLTYIQTIKLKKRASYV